MSQKTVTIKAPKGLKGDIVIVLNYRRCPRNVVMGGVWEEGKICGVKYDLGYAKNIKEGSWHYEVILTRKTPSNIDYFGKEKGQKSILLYVSDRSIK